MAKSTPMERRRRILRIAIGASVLALAAGAVFVITRLYPDAESAVIQLAQNPTVHVVLVGIGLAIVVFSEILDNADKLKLLRELLYSLLGYDTKVIALRNRDFSRIPDDYEHREELEQEAATLLRAGTGATEPQLVIMRGDRDTGKTTLINYVASRSLVKRYRGRVLLCRGDQHSIEVGPGDTDEDIREKLIRRIFTRIIDEAEVPGDPGDSLDGMKKAIRDFFREERHPWLVVIDQIEDGSFPYESVLPTLFGTRNIVLVACRYPVIPGPALYAAGADTQIEPQEIRMRPFTQKQAQNLLRAELRKRRVSLSKEMIGKLFPQLQGTSPGVIQRLSDALRDPQAEEHLAEMTETLSAIASDESRESALSELTANRFSDVEIRYLTALALLRRDDISTALLRYLGYRINGETGKGALLEWCLDRGYIKLNEAERTRGDSAPYRLSKLGQGMVRAARLRAGKEAELQAGTYVLDYYRALAQGREVESRVEGKPRTNVVLPSLSRRRLEGTVREGADLLSELPGLLQAMAWSQTPPRMMPRTDAVTFARVLRRAFYFSGEWHAGLQWLTYAAILAREDDLPCTLGDLESAIAVVLLGRGLPGQALETIASAREAYERSEEQAQADLKHSLVPSYREALEDSVNYNKLQILWLAHLEAQAKLAKLPPVASVEALEGIRELVHQAQHFVQVLARGAGTHYDTLIRSTQLALQLDDSELALHLGDLYASHGDWQRSTLEWRRARQLAASARRLPPVIGRLTGPEGMARAYRLEGAALRRYAWQAGPLVRPFWRRAAIHYLRQSLRYCELLPSRYEQVLALHETALVAIAGLSSMGRFDAGLRERPQGGWLRYSVAHILPRWHRLNAALRLLRGANSTAAALGADAEHLHMLLTLVRLSLEVWCLDRSPMHLATAREFATSARSIKDRLNERAPELEAYLEVLPDQLLPASHALDQKTPEAALVSSGVR